MGPMLVGSKNATIHGKCHSDRIRLEQSCIKFELVSCFMTPLFHRLAEEKTILHRGDFQNPQVSPGQKVQPPSVIKTLRGFSLLK